MHFLTNIKPVGIALHLAVDFQGWEPPQDFAQHFVTRARTISVHNGMSDFHFQGLEGSTVNGRGETYTFGKANYPARGGSTTSPRKSTSATNAPSWNPSGHPKT